jgi:hypothetical protein
MLNNSSDRAIESPDRVMIQEREWLSLAQMRVGFVDANDAGSGSTHGSAYIEIRASRYQIPRPSTDGFALAM